MYEYIYIYTHTSNYFRYTDVRFAPLQKKTLKFSFSCLVYILVVSIVDTPGGSANILTTFNVCTRGLEHVLSYPRHSVPYSAFELLKIFIFELTDEVSHIPTRRNLLELSLVT